jgi:flagellar motor switch protein FliG
MLFSKKKPPEFGPVPMSEVRRAVRVMMRIAGMPDGPDRFVHFIGDALERTCDASDLTRREAAVFIMSLGGGAEPLLKALPDAVPALTFEMARTGSVSIDELRNVIVSAASALESTAMNGNLETAGGVIASALGKETARSTIEQLTSSLQVTPFAFLSKQDPEKVRELMDGEHPQIQALILRFLPPAMSAGILDSMENKVDLMYRLARMSAVGPDTVREMERVLERKLSRLADGSNYGPGDCLSAIEEAGHGRNAESG